MPPMHTSPTASPARPLRHCTSLRRRGAAAIEVVLATAVTLPLAVVIFFLGAQICGYVFRALSGLLTMPFL